MVKVVERGRFRVYVFDERGQPHHLPHCHVLWSDGKSVVSIDDLAVLAGNTLPAAARALLQEHQAEIHRAWQRLNGEERRR